MKKNSLVALLLIFITSCTITDQKYETSTSMSFLRNALHSVSTNPIIPRIDLLKMSAKLKGLANYATKQPNYVFSKQKIDGLDFSIFKNENNKDLSKTKVIYLMHGGAFFTPLLKEYYNTFEYILSKMSVKPDIYMIDYDVYPAKYPVAHDQAYQGYFALLNMGYKAENIVFMGDSAGGHLSVSLALKLKDEKKQLPKAIVLFSPWLDILNEGSSRITNLTTDPLLGNTYMYQELEPEIKDPYYFKGSDKQNPYVNPIKGDFKNFPYTYIQSDKVEILYSDAKTLNEKINEAGGSSKFDEFSGNFHDFQIFGPQIPEVKNALDKVSLELDKILGEK